MPDQLRQCYLTTSLDVPAAQSNFLGMKFIKWASAILSLLVALGGGVSIFRHGADSVSPVGGTHNRYEAARHSTVLLVAPDGGQGTGIVIRRGDRTFVWTANHVVENATSVKVQSIIHSGFHRVGFTEFTGRVIAFNKELDVALLFVDAPARYFLPADFDSIVPPPVGTALYHVGNFLGADFDNSVSTGILSQHGVQPKFPNWPWTIVDQTTLPVMPGSSGGPVFNSQNDKVVGLVVGTLRGDDVNFYVPVRAIEVWAESAGLAWAVRGNESPAVLPTITKPVPFIKIFSVE